jgi:AhpD family alkylhydroperoxidase
VELQMPRIAALPEEHATPEVRAVYEMVRRKYGAVLDPIAVTAHNAAVLHAYVGFESALRRAAALPDKLEELVNLKVAALLGCPFCIDIGSALARRLGVDDATLDDLPVYADSPWFAPAEKAALCYAEAMSGATVAVSDALFAELATHFDTVQLIELTAVIAWENYRSRFNHALGLQAHGFVEPQRRVRAESGAPGSCS